MIFPKIVLVLYILRKEEIIFKGFKGFLISFFLIIESTLVDFLTKVAL